MVNESWAIIYTLQNVWRPIVDQLGYVMEVIEPRHEAPLTVLLMSKGYGDDAGWHFFQLDLSDYAYGLSRLGRSIDRQMGDTLRSIGLPLTDLETSARLDL